MTPQEFDYIKRAVLAIESGQESPESEAKILRIVSQICEKGAVEAQNKSVDILVDRCYTINTN